MTVDPSAPIVDTSYSRLLTPLTLRLKGVSNRGTYLGIGADGPHRYIYLQNLFEEEKQLIGFGDQMTKDVIDNQSLSSIEQKDRQGYIQNSSLFLNRIEREWLTTKEAAQFLGVSENALRIMVYRGQISAFKFGRRLRFKLKDCEALFVKKGA